MGIYLDNASTTFPKPTEVAESVYQFMTGCGSNINRGGYDSAYDAGMMVFETRQMLCDLFDGPDVRNVIFTKNVTESLNIVLKGLLRPGDHILVSAMEHNAVMRPLIQLTGQSTPTVKRPEQFPKDQSRRSCVPVSDIDHHLSDDKTFRHSISCDGISFDRIPCDEQGRLILSAVEGMIRPGTKAICMTHASNVCGTLMPIKEVGEICHRLGISFIVDAAQTAGVWNISMKEMHIDALCFTGHKGLMGPQGIGGFIVTDEMAAQLTPLLAGGTGSISHTETVPDFLPDRFEPGTLNLPGIAGLNASLKWIRRTGMDRIRRHELLLAEAFMQKISEIKGIRILGIQPDRFSDDYIDMQLPVFKDPDDSSSDCTTSGFYDSCHEVSGSCAPDWSILRTGVVSVTTPDHDEALIADRLAQEFHIQTRVGLHCAPNAHRTLGSYPEGSIRFSFGWFNTEEDVMKAALALQSIMNSSYIKNIQSDSQNTNCSVKNDLLQVEVKSEKADN